MNDGNRWLKTYYLLRGTVSVVWVGAALLVMDHSPVIAGALLLIYPAWDAVANVMDAQKTGGLRNNPTQASNAAVSVITTAAVGVGLTMSMNVVLAVFGVWAALSGLLQLATALRRWKSHGAQWLMILSGAQSAFAGTMFLGKAAGPDMPSVADLAPYAAFGAFYFLVSGLWLIISDARRRRLSA